MALELIDLGLIEYQAAREVQRQRIALGSDRPTLICCEHPPTITLTKRSALSERDFAGGFWVRERVTVERVDRGGLATFHGPGQLMIYPVVNLRRARLGVRSFIRLGLEAMVEVSQQYGVEALASDSPAGVWIRNANSGGSLAKLGFAGVRIQAGFSDHGFALNVRNSLTPYAQFSSCGLTAEVTSLAAHLGLRAEQLPAMSEVAAGIHKTFCVRLGV